MDRLFAFNMEIMEELLVIRLAFRMVYRTLTAFHLVLLGLLKIRAMANIVADLICRFYYQTIWASAELTVNFIWTCSTNVTKRVQEGSKSCFESQ